MDANEMVKSAEDHEKTPEFVIERYKYILQQIHAVNENTYRFLALFQTASTALVTATLALFVGYRKWGIPSDVAHAGVVGLLLLITVSAAFVVLLMIVGVASWIDCRREECELANRFFLSDFRTPPRLRNFWRWYETYIVLFIIIVTSFLWILAATYLLPHL